MESVTLLAPDISCEHCRHAIEEALGEEAGVRDVAVDIEAKSVKVAFDPAVTSRAALANRLDEEGYPVAG
jgi:copper chaperone